LKDRKLSFNFLYVKAAQLTVIERNSYVRSVVVWRDLKSRLQRQRWRHHHRRIRSTTAHSFTYADLCTGVPLVRNRQISLLSRLGNKRDNDPRPCLSLDNVIYRHEIDKKTATLYFVSMRIISLGSDLSLIFIMYLVW